MGRVSESPFPGKYFVYGFWSYPYYNGFTIWRDYLEVSKRLLKKKALQINAAIKEFDKNKPNLTIQLSDGEPIGWDGYDQHLDELQTIEDINNKIFPLVLIGCYTDFESALKKICNELCKHNLSITKAVDKEQHEDKCKKYYKKLKKISDCEDFFKNELGYEYSAKLSEMWNRIQLFNDLRNLFAHNNNPVNIDDSSEVKRLERIKKLDEENIIINADNLVVIKNNKPIVEFITLCDGFINGLYSDLIDIK